ncbi:MAG: CDP-alcohol phosphatidyltransferase family protein [Thermoplasmata archaeon]|nr:CDP-alcohol phosphatidyltransferase family protein [Thermoplasmata archaeon]
MKFLRLVSVADVLTLGNGLCGALAIITFILYAPDATLGSGFILFGMLFDGADGWAARKFGTKHDYGRYLDSYSDSITFCLAPAVMAFVIFADLEDGLGGIASVRNLLVLAGAVLIVACGWWRLYKFTIEGYKLKAFAGLATPAMTFMVLILVHVLDPHRSENSWVYIPYICMIIIIIGSILMISNVRYPKLRGKLAYALAVGIVIGLLATTIPKLQNIESSDVFLVYRLVSFVGLVMVIFYVLISPIAIFYKDKST